jgi:hypothetical protein
MAEPTQPGVRVKITDEILRGTYANQMVVTHTREEFVMDWANLLPPEGIVVARVIVSPAHMKRVLRALADNLRQYEERHGAIPESPDAPAGPPPSIVN